MNNAFLVKAEKYLANKNFASVKFSMIHTPMDTKAMIEKATGGLELVTEGDTRTIKRTTLSLTGLLTIFKSSLADSEAFILNSMYSEFYKDYIAKAKKRRGG
jgi:hypothetical protein